MRVALFLLAFLVAGCHESASEKAEKTALMNVRAAASIDFTQQGDINTLSKAIENCLQSHRDGCDVVREKTKTVADAIATCANHDSSLCYVISKIQALRQFNGGTARHLPNHPFFWSLGNELLDAQASSFDFRSEMWDSWLDRSRIFLWLTLAGILTTAALWFLFYLFFEDIARKEAQETCRRASEAQNKELEARRIQEAAREAAEAQARAKSVQREQNAAREAAAAQEQVRKNAEEEERRLDAEVEAALESAFKKKPKR